MTDTAEELFDRLDRLPWGAAYRAEAERLIALADEAADPEFEFGARMRLTTYAVISGVSDLALTNFAWCLAKHKEDPARFVGDANSPEGTIFWHYKWMPGLLTGSPAFDAAQIDSVMEDFEATYRAAALPLSAVVTARMEAAISMRKTADAERWAAELKRMPEDAYSSCDACVPSDYVNLEVLRGDDKAAAKLALKMWKQGVACGDEPEGMLASTLIPMLRSGRDAKAVEAFQYVYEQSKGDKADLGHIAHCILFAAVTGNDERAFDMVERHIGWLAHDALSESEHRSAAAAFAVALTRLERSGYADVVVRGSAEPTLTAVLPPADAPRTVAELARIMWDLAEDLTARFDARNGNDGFASWLKSMRELVDTTYPRELPTSAGDGFRPMLVRRTTPQNAQEWLERAFDHRWADEQVLTLDALSHALPGLEGKALARAYGLQRTCAGAIGDVELEQRATSAWFAALEAAYGAETAAFVRATFENASPDDVAKARADYPGAHVGYVGSTLTQLASTILTGDVGEEQIEQAAQHLAVAMELAESILDDPDTHLSYASMLLFTSQVAAAQGNMDEAFGMIDKALHLVQSRTAVAVLTGAKALLAGRSGDLAAAADLHGTAVAVAAAAGQSSLAARQAVYAGSALTAADRDQEAAARFAYALSLTPPGETPAISHRWAYALASLNSGDAAAAVPFLEQIRDEESAGEPGPATIETHYQLGRAYDATYDDRAAGEYLTAARGSRDAGAYGLAAVAAYAAGKELRFQEKAGEAIEAFELAMECVKHEPDAGMEIEVLLSYAGALSAHGDDRWQEVADRMVTTAQAAAEEVSPELLAKALFARLSLLDDHAVHDRIIELADEVTAHLLATDEQGRASASVHWKATSLLETGRFDASVDLLAAAAHNELHGTEERREYAERLTDMYTEVGRKSDASKWKAYRKRLKGE